jgi:hypothetical protein
MPQPRRKRVKGREPGQTLLKFKPVAKTLTNNAQAEGALAHGGIKQPIQPDHTTTPFDSQSTEHKSSDGSHTSAPQPGTSHLSTSQPTTSPRLYPRFEARIRHVVARMRFVKKSAVWETLYPHYSDERFVQFILDYTVESMKELLDREEAPTFKQLQEIPWIETKDMGVYGKLLESPVMELNDFLYTGSATSYDHGLRHRKRAHINNIARKTRGYKYIISSA